MNAASQISNLKSLYPFSFIFFFIFIFIWSSLPAPAQPHNQRRPEPRGGERGASRQPSRGGSRNQPQLGLDGRPAAPGTIIPMRVKPKPSLVPIASTPTTQTFAIPPVDMRKPIGIGLNGPENAEFADKHLRPGDLVIVIRPEDAALLTSGTAPSRGIILRGNDLAQAEQTFKWAKENGINDVALNLDGLPHDELVARQRALYQLAKIEGLRFTFGPKVSDLQTYAAELTQNADMIMVQAQRYQGGAEFAKTVAELVARVRAANPKIKIWVQVSMVPPYAPQLTGEQVLEEILDAAAAADGVFIYYPPEKWEATRRVLTALRPLDTSGLVKPPSTPALR